MDTRFVGKVAVVTGASGGIGAACAQRLHDEGAAVLLVGRDLTKLEATCAQLGADERLAVAVAEAADETAMAAALALAVDRFGGIDLVVANAGDEGLNAPLEHQEIGRFRQLLDTNVVGVWLCIKHAAPWLRRRGGGAIVAMASMAGYIGFPGAGPYIASKHAVCGLVKTAALELGAARIRVNAVAPGPIENRMMRAIEQQIGGSQAAAVKELMCSRLALGHYGRNEDVAALVAFLGSADSAFCTGSVHLVDGGYCAA